MMAKAYLLGSDTLLGQILLISSTLNYLLSIANLLEYKFSFGLDRSVLTSQPFLFPWAVSPSLSLCLELPWKLVTACQGVKCGLGCDPSSIELYTQASSCKQTILTLSSLLAPFIDCNFTWKWRPFAVTLDGVGSRKRLPLLLWQLLVKLYLVYKKQKGWGKVLL